MKIGSCLFWDSKPWLDVANILTAADDPLLALKVLDMVPAYYRLNKDKALEEMRRKILKNIVTPHWYSTCEDKLVTDDEAKLTCQGTRRGIEVMSEIKKLNDVGHTPCLIDLAPGTYWLPIGLRALGLGFTYWPITLNKQIYDEANKRIGFSLSEDASCHIYCAFELIEHLHHEDDIRIEIERLGITPKYVHLSTPYCTYDGRSESLDWSKKDLGHIRTYTPHEFINVACRLFPNYNWNVITEQVMHLRGELNVNK